MIMGIILIGCFSDNSKIREYDEQGNLYREFSIDADSLIHGTLYTYYENGKDIFEQSEYNHGQLNGQRILYYPNQIPEIIEQYRNDTISDTLKVFYPNGQIKRRVPYQSGVRVGVLESFYPAGEIKERVSFENNLENGPFEEFYKNGFTKWKGTYLNGENEFGELLHFDSTGSMIRKMICDSLAICRTVWSTEQEDPM